MAIKVEAEAAPGDPTCMEGKAGFGMPYPPMGWNLVSVGESSSLSIGTSSPEENSVLVRSGRLDAPPCTASGVNEPSLGLWALAYCSILLQANKENDHKNDDTYIQSGNGRG